MKRLWLFALLLAIATVATPAHAQSYTHPEDYCRAVGTIDKPDARYTGPKLPRWMARQLNLTPAQASQMEWRCAGGKVMACVYGANIPCNAKANTSSAPTAGIADYCRQNPNADSVPAVVTGHETNVSWACRAGQPYVTGSAELDAQGYVKSYWRVLEP